MIHTGFLILQKEQSEDLKDEFISIEAILLAMTKLDNSYIQSALKEFGVNQNSVLNVMKKIRGNKKWIIKMQKKI